MPNQKVPTLTDPGEYEVILKGVRVERFNPARGTVGKRVCWSLAVDGGDHDKQLIYLTMPLLDQLPWGVCKALRAFGVARMGNGRSSATPKVVWSTRGSPLARAHVRRS